MSYSWNNDSMPQSFGFTVTGNRRDDDWFSIDADDLATIGVFSLGGGEAFQGQELPTLDNPARGPERRRIDDNRPSPGQEDFAADGDPFNDGEAPTRQTVESWLQSGAEAGTFVFYQVNSDVSDGATTYSGSYTTNEGRSYTFSSDGEGNYGQSEVGASGASYDDFVF